MVKAAIHVKKLICIVEQVSGSVPKTDCITSKQVQDQSWAFCLYYIYKQWSPLFKSKLTSAVDMMSAVSDSNPAVTTRQPLPNEGLTTKTSHCSCANTDRVVGGHNGVVTSRYSNGGMHRQQQQQRWQGMNIWVWQIKLTAQLVIAMRKLSWQIDISGAQHHSSCLAELAH